MKSFISETVQDILKTTKTFENAVFVLPSQRAGVFVKQTLKDNISSGFLPEIINIEQFISRISEVQKADAVQLLFHFYTIYKEQEPNPDSFDIFSSWAFTVIQDFNAIQGEFKETELIKDHFKFIEKLNEYYNAFYQFLLEKRIGYQGVLYREATKKADDYILKNPQKNFFFIGFNSLNASEDFLFQKFLFEGKAEVYWDI